MAVGEPVVGLGLPAGAPEPSPLSSRSLLARAEALLAGPSLGYTELARAEEAAALLGQAVAGIASAGLPREGAREDALEEARQLRSSVKRVSALLEAAWKARLGLYRISAAGQAGYLPHGASEDSAAGPLADLAGAGLRVDG